MPKLCLMIVLLSMIASCRGCGADAEEITSVGSDMIVLQVPNPPAPPPPKRVPEPPVEKEVVIRAEPEPPTEIVEREPILDPEELINVLAEDDTTPVPPGTFESEELTVRLKEKLAEAYAGDLDKVPDATIYLSNGTLEDFIDFYEERGYQVTRITVPVRRILQPVLRDRPELADSIHMEDYEDELIYQAMVRGTGISAADKYIDPDTYEIIEQLFVTEMPIQ